jgi:hypothetical protein
LISDADSRASARPRGGRGSVGAREEFDDVIHGGS